MSNWSRLVGIITIILIFFPGSLEHKSWIWLAKTFQSSDKFLASKETVVLRQKESETWKFGFNQLQSVWISNETLFQVFDIASQSINYC